MKRTGTRSIILTILILLALLSLVSCIATKGSEREHPGHTTKLITIESRPGVTQKFIFIRPENPVAAVILLAGGQGDLRLGERWGKPVVGWGENCFVVRARELFADQGLMVALLDTPSDKRSYDEEFQGLNSLSESNEIFRASREHAQDIETVAAYLKTETDIPVWVIGTSWGTFSAANAAIRLKTGIDGLVLTSSMTRSHRTRGKLYNYYPNCILDLNLGQITVPTLIVAHRSDRCFFTPPNQATKIKNALTISRKADVLFVSSGLLPVEKDCEGLSAHGFYGNEEQVVAAISTFIRKMIE